MKRFIINFLLFGLFTAIFYCCTLVVWAKVAPSAFKPNFDHRIGYYGHTYTRLLEAKHVNDIDILFLGSSQAYRGFDPRIFEEKGFTSFNLGSNAQTPVQTRLLLNRYLDNLNPKKIIYAVSLAIFINDGIESSLDIIANDKNDFYSLKMAFELNHIKVYNSLLYAVMSDILNLNSSFVEPAKKEDDTYIVGGFVEKNIQTYKPIPLLNREWKFHGKQLKAFKDVIDIIIKRDIELILVHVPVAPSFYHFLSSMSEFDVEMANYAEYLNFNEVLQLEDSKYFYDSYHLNQNGVELFNEKLLEIIQ